MPDSYQSAARAGRSCRNLVVDDMRFTALDPSSD
jgi:hypothetical protein